MKSIIIACLILVALGNELDFYHYTDGTIQVNGETPVKTSGPVFLEFLANRNYTVVGGMYAKNSKDIPFDFRANIVKFKSGDNFEIEGKCADSNWGLKAITTEGVVKVKGDKNALEYEGTCESKDLKMKWTMKAKAKRVTCPFYPPTESAKRVEILIGQSDENFKPVHVLNYATTGIAYMYDVSTCSVYLKHSKQVSDGKPGFIIIDNKADYCAIIDKEGDKFIHSNPVNHQVTSTPMAMINAFFRNGYTIRDYTC